MEKLKERIAIAQKALSKLHEAAIREDLSEIERDGLIQRFEFSFELAWKCGKQYLRAVHGIDVASPKSVIRSSREVGLLSDEEAEQALAMTDDRNLASHTYDEAFAKLLIPRLRAYDALMAAWLGRIAAPEGCPRAGDKATLP